MPPTGWRRTVWNRSLKRSMPAKARTEFLGNLRLLAENGFMGLNVSADYGGTEAGAIGFSQAVQALAGGCASTAVTVSVTNMVGEVIQAVGSDEQKAAYLPKLTDGTYAAGGFLPDGILRRIRPLGDEDPRGQGRQSLRSQWCQALYHLGRICRYLRRLGRDRSGCTQGQGHFLFPGRGGNAGSGDRQGREKKMGQTGSATNEVLFQDCRVPATAMMGGENDGFRIAVGELAGGRIGIASLALGIARKAMDTAKAFVKEREQFGRPLADMQGLQWMIADRETELEAARLLILQAAALKDAGRPYSKEASMAKLYASEAAQRATYTALQLHGGAGYIKEYPLERFARDARITTIYEGTSEIQRLIIAREVMKAV